MSEDKMKFVKGEEIEKVPEGAKRVTIKGYCFHGEGRGFGYKLMSFAEKIDCYSPYNNQIQGEEEISVYIRYPKNENAKLIQFLNTMIDQGHEVIFSKS